jgi:5-methylcytosine-specific restriction endonuclease McrA
MRTLVLDQGYQPHRVVSWQKAVTLLFGGKVEVVEEYDEPIRSVSLTIQMPAVVRLLHRFRGHRGIKFSRVNVMARDHFMCQYCSVRPGVKGLTFDHVKPRSQGGATSWTNIVTACRPCNGKKGNRTPEQAGMQLRKRPEQPTWLPVTCQLDIQRIPERWSGWLDWRAAIQIE